MSAQILNQGHMIQTTNRLYLGIPPFTIILNHPPNFQHPIITLNSKRMKITRDINKEKSAKSNLQAMYSHIPKDDTDLWMTPKEEISLAGSHQRIYRFGYKFVSLDRRYLDRLTLHQTSTIHILVYWFMVSKFVSCVWEAWRVISRCQAWVVHTSRLFPQLVSIRGKSVCFGGRVVSVHL